MRRQSIEINDYATELSPEMKAQEAKGLTSWLNTFWIPTVRRKNPAFTFTFTDTALSVTSNNDDELDDWNKLLGSALKKIIVEDLGQMNANELVATIPLEDSGGRGLQDLQQMEKALQVKVVFCDNGHVLLVGQKAKLTKKCFTIKNILSHYHWRLSGKDVAFS
jgi:hypothetical protein